MVLMMMLLPSYLTDRQQRVKFDGKFSEWCPVKCGIPQGSLLGPLLFNIFLNDLNFAGQISSLRLYADDTTTYHMTRTALHAISLENHKRKGPV